jgi:hypothetical protein
MRDDLTLALRRFRLAYLLKGSVLSVDDLMPSPSPAPASRSDESGDGGADSSQHEANVTG